MKSNCDSFDTELPIQVMSYISPLLIFYLSLYFWQRRGQKKSPGTIFLFLCVLILFFLSCDLNSGLISFITFILWFGFSPLSSSICFTSFSLFLEMRAIPSMSLFWSFFLDKLLVDRLCSFERRNTKENHFWVFLSALQERDVITFSSQPPKPELNVIPLPAAQKEWTPAPVCGASLEITKLHYLLFFHRKYLFRLCHHGNTDSTCCPSNLPLAPLFTNCVFAHCDYYFVSRTLMSFVFSCLNLISIWNCNEIKWFRIERCVCFFLFFKIN